MDINEYKVIITPRAYKEINKIYNYISEDLYAKGSADKLMGEIENKIQKLKYFPRIYAEIEKLDELKRIYRKIVIKNFVVLYTIDEKNKRVYVSHMYYGKQNYI